MVTSEVFELEKPLTLSELLAATVQIYRRRAAALLVLGLFQAAAFVAAQALPVAAGLAVLALAFALSFAAVSRVVSGDPLSQALIRTGRTFPELVVLGFIVGVPFTLASSWILLWFVAVLWLGFMAFAIPVIMLERPPGRGWLDAVTYALRRTARLARTQYAHAVGVAATLFLVDLVVGVGLALVLNSYADQTRIAAVAISQLVLAPFFFAGLTVLYFEQRARERDKRE